MVCALLVLQKGMHAKVSNLSPCSCILCANRVVGTLTSFSNLSSFSNFLTPASASSWAIQWPAELSTVEASSLCQPFVFLFCWSILCTVSQANALNLLLSFIRTQASDIWSTSPYIEMDGQPEISPKDASFPQSISSIS